MKPVLLDTNIFIAAAQKTPIFQELATEFQHMQPTTLEGVIEELKRLRDEGTRVERRDASVALGILEKQHLNIVPQSIKHVDDALLAYATESGAFLATLDKELQERARRLSIPVLTIKQRRFLRRQIP